MSAEDVVLVGIVEMMKRAKHPLSETQTLLLAGSLPVWIDKIKREAGQGSILEIVRRQHKGFGEPVIAMGRTKQKKQ